MFTGYRIALVEDDEIMGASILQRLELEGAEVVWIKNARQALGALRTPKKAFDAVVCDIRLPDGSGEEIFEKLSQHTVPPPFLFLTGHGGVEQAVRLLRAGAYDYLQKPFDMGQFLNRLREVAFDQGSSESEPVLGPSTAARRVEDMVGKVAALDLPVLIQGEAGTGKGLLAKRIHDLSDRRAAPYRSISLAKTTDTEASAIVFGDAGEGGLASSCDDGTLYISAVADAPPDLQERVLELIETSHFSSVGGGRRAFRGRLIVSGADDLDRAVSDGRFRADLLFRLNALKITVPPLRERPDDAVWLLHRFFQQINGRQGKPLSAISTLTEERVRAHPWPGNGRELRSRVQRAVRLAAGDVLFPTDLFPEARVDDTHQDDLFPPLSEVRSQAEKEHIGRALEVSEGHVANAANLLGVSRTTLWEKMQKLGLQSRSDS